MDASISAIFARFAKTMREVTGEGTKGNLAARKETHGSRRRVLSGKVGTYPIGSGHVSRLAMLPTGSGPADTARRPDADR